MSTGQIGIYRSVGGAAALSSPGVSEAQSAVVNDSVSGLSEPPTGCSAEHKVPREATRPRRMWNSGDNLPCRIRLRLFRTLPVRRPETNKNKRVSARIPHQSQIGCEEPICASFSPGEAIAACDRCRPIGATISKHQQNAKRKLLLHFARQKTAPHPFWMRRSSLREISRSARLQ